MIPNVIHRRDESPLARCLQHLCRECSGLHVQRAGKPTQVWPGVQGETWWLDPAHAPGGGWVGVLAT